MSFTGNGITNCYPDQVEDFISITVLRMANLPESYGTEVNKGRNLARFVTVKRS